jgi:hypothetical protein
MAWHGMAWHGMAWHGMAWHGMAWHGKTQTQHTTHSINRSTSPTPHKSKSSTRAAVDLLRLVLRCNSNLALAKRLSARSCSAACSEPLLLPAALLAAPLWPAPALLCVTGANEKELKATATAERVVVDSGEW